MCQAMYISLSHEKAALVIPILEMRSEGKDFIILSLLVLFDFYPRIGAFLIDHYLTEG